MPDAVSPPLLAARCTYPAPQWRGQRDYRGAKITRKIREAGSAATAVIARSKAADLATVIADELRNSAQRRCAGRLRLRKGVA